MARYSSNFGNELQVVVEIRKEYGFTSNLYMPRPFTPTQNKDTAQNDKQPVRLPTGLLYPRVEVEKRAHSGDKTVILGHFSLPRVQNARMLLNVIFAGRENNWKFYSWLDSILWVFERGLQQKISHIDGKEWQTKAG